MARRCLGGGRFQGRGFSIYLKTGDGLVGLTNVQLLGALRGRIKQLAGGLPWLVVGNWNADPAAVGEPAFARTLSGIVLDTGEATFATTASNLDFAVAHRSLAGLIAVQAVWDVPWRPHAALVVNISWSCLNLEMPKLRIYKDMPCLPARVCLGLLLGPGMRSYEMSWPVRDSSFQIRLCPKFLAIGWRKLRVG